MLLPSHPSVERAPASATSSVDVDARARAFAPEYRHRHYRDDGRGLIEHRHEVRSTRHGHPALGLLMVRLTWIGFSWTRAGGFVVYVGTIAVYVGLALMTLIGWLYFARTVRWP